MLCLLSFSISAVALESDRQQPLEIGVESQVAGGHPCRYAHRHGDGEPQKRMSIRSARQQTPHSIDHQPISPVVVCVALRGRWRSSQPIRSQWTIAVAPCNQGSRAKVAAVCPTRAPAASSQT